AVPRARSVAVIRRSLRGPRLCPAAYRCLVIARHGGAGGDRVEPVEIACLAGLPPGLGGRAAGIGAAPVQPAALHDLWQPRLYPVRRADRAAPGPARSRGVARR